jgi:SpoVK/Ycf46/Vps4 family AAA+-type ATPase
MAFELAGPPADEKAVITFLADYLKAEPATEDQKNKPSAPLTDLENLVGLSTVKERVREILAHFAVEKKKAALGISGSDLCMHMLFTGNPGTGKTTVARIIGRVLKEEGLLKKGDLIEACREDLISRYLGNTAPKTADLVKKSIGSVLFIDEAYSLDGGHDRDYGHEALATLVKLMEEHKGELVVIMAGYSDEMEKMVSLNPGLTSRVPHQIHFPDYNAEELYHIFEQHIGKNYQIEQAAVEKLKELFATAASVCHRQSGNGRFIRNVVERLKMKQGIRLAALENPNQEELLQINLEDVLALLEDRDITEVLGKMDSKLIGF